jgi:hypothetical protein
MRLFELQCAKRNINRGKRIDSQGPQEEMNGDVSPFRADTSHSAPLALIDNPMVMESQYSTAVPLSKELCCLISHPLLLPLGQLIGW